MLEELDLTGWVIAFDLDGTLVDTAPDLVRALNACLADLALPPTRVGDVRELVGHGSKALILRALERGGLALNDSQVLERQRRFIEVYAHGIAELSRPFTGAESTVKALNAAGAQCVICTNKPQKLTDLLIKTLYWADLFERWVGADDAPAKKPDPAHLFTATRYHPADRTLYVGDSDVDVETGKRAGVPTAILRHGYSPIPFEALGADALLNGFDELEGFIRAATTH